MVLENISAIHLVAFVCTICCLMYPVLTMECANGVQTDVMSWIHKLNCNGKRLTYKNLTSINNFDELVDLLKSIKVEDRPAEEQGHTFYCLSAKTKVAGQNIVVKSCVPKGEECTNCNISQITQSFGSFKMDSCELCYSNLCNSSPNPNLCDVRLIGLLSLLIAIYQKVH